MKQTGKTMLPDYYTRRTANDPPRRASAQHDPSLSTHKELEQPNGKKHIPAERSKQQPHRRVTHRTAFVTG